MVTQENIERSKEIVAYYTFAAAATGAVPVPAASVAIVGETGIMIAHIASELGAEITVENVAASVGFSAALNIIGRTIFIEGAKLLSWGTGSLWMLAGLSLFGATTAGVQTYILGRIAIEIGKNGGKALTSDISAKVIEESKNSYDAFVAEWKEKKPGKPA